MNTLMTIATHAGSGYDGPGPWWPIFPILWLLLIIGMIASFRFFGMRRWRQVQGYAGTRAGEAKLAEREILRRRQTYGLDVPVAELLNRP